MRHTVAEISFRNLEYNLNYVRKAAGKARILAIVKANAYGHGIVRISRKLEELGVGLFGVAYADEGVVLRQAGIAGNIYVLIPEANGNARVCVENDLTPTVSSLEFLEALNTEAENLNKIVNAHLFIDTGMNREGIRPAEALDFMLQTEKFKNVNINGICTHFATAASQVVFAGRQLELFNETLELLKNKNFEFDEIHAANSAAMVVLPDSKFNIVRPGLTLYGYPPTIANDTTFDVKPLMTVKSKVISVREIDKGDTVGYGMKYISDKKRKIATVPVGYGDGYLRSLTNKAECIIKGKRYRIIGTVCMDSCMIDIGDATVVPGDDVIIFGGNPAGDFISAYELATLADTIPYELLSAVSARVPRIYID
jgi:alanine racemase